MEGLKGSKGGHRLPKNFQKFKYFARKLKKRPTFWVLESQIVYHKERLKILTFLGRWLCVMKYDESQDVVVTSLKLSTCWLPGQADTYFVTQNPQI